MMVDEIRKELVNGIIPFWKTYVMMNTADITVCWIMT